MKKLEEYFERSGLSRASIPFLYNYLSSFISQNDDRKGQNKGDKDMEISLLSAFSIS
jgi:hypothetical protein